MILLDLFRFLPAMMVAATITAETNKYDKSLLIPNKTEWAFRSQSLSSLLTLVRLLAVMSLPCALGDLHVREDSRERGFLR